MSTKRILSLVLALVMVLGTFGTMVFAEGPTGNAKVDWLIDQGIVTGNEHGDYMLDKTIDRASVAKMVVEALDLGTVAEGMKNYKTAFKDVPVTHWANGYINVVSSRGLMIGDAGNFMPGNQISYAEVLTILVRMLDGFTAAEEKVAVWPTSYIAKAHELGVLEGLTVANYQEPALRAAILEMFYNAMVNREIGNNTIVKAIVLENNRVEAIGKDDVVVEIIREVQRANYADASRYEKGDQERLEIPAKVNNVEEMLGKVYDFTLDRNGKVINAKLDTTYTYYAGPLYQITRNKVNNYTVELDERYKDKDERIFRTYHNDKAYAYVDFDKDFAGVDYARVTVKNGKVLFIDAYTFEDIAPVQEAKRDGSDIYVYNDYRDGRVEKFEPRALVVGFKDGKFSRIERSDIRANDVVHVYGRNRVIVRQDAIVTGVYQKVERDRDNNYFVHVEDEAYYIGDVDYFRPVYAHDSKAYSTLFARNASGDLGQFYKEEVTILVDMNDDLQLFGGDIEYAEGFALVQQVLARGQVRFVQANNETLTLDEDYASFISIYNPVNETTTINQKLHQFNTRDLVFVLGNEKIDTLVRLYTEKEMRDDLVTLKSAKAGDMNNSYIRLDNDYRYQVLDRTNVFVINQRGAISATTVAKLQAGLKADSVVKAFVLTDEDVTKLIEDEVIYDRHRITNKKDIAHTIVFFDLEYAAAGTDGEIVLVDSVFTARAPHGVNGIRSDRPGDKEYVRRDAAAGVNLRPLNTDDIVQLNLTKDDDKLVRSFNVLIPSDKVKTDSYKVVGGQLDYSRYDYRRLELEDATGQKMTKWLVRGVEEFGTVTIDSVITFHEDGNGDIDVIRVYRKGTPVTANIENVPGEKVILNNVYKLAGQIWVRINNVDYKYVGLQTEAELANLVGKEVAFNTLKLGNETVVDEVVELVPTP